MSRRFDKSCNGTACLQDVRSHAGISEAAARAREYRHSSARAASWADERGGDDGFPAMTSAPVRGARGLILEKPRLLP